MIIVGNDAQFRSFCAALRMPEVLTDPRFTRNADRLRHADALALLIGQALRNRTLAECQALFDAAGVPASPINTLAQVFADPQVIARGMVREVARPGWAAGPGDRQSNPHVANAASQRPPAASARRAHGQDGRRASMGTLRERQKRACQPQRRDYWIALAEAAYLPRT